MGKFKSLELIQKEIDYMKREEIKPLDDHPFFDELVDDDVSDWQDIDDLNDDLYND